MITEKVMSPRLGLGPERWKDRRDISETQSVLILVPTVNLVLGYPGFHGVKTWKQV